MTRLVLTAFCAAAAFSAPRTNLSGAWDFRFDPDSKGEQQGWHQAAGQTGWTKIRVPGSYNQARYSLLPYQGKAWYRTTFKAPPGSAGDHIFLQFGGVTIRSKIWVNGILIGEHLFPYTRFEFDITSAVRRDSLNALAVLVDNEILEKAIPDKKWTGWWNFGGINRAVFLESRPAVHTGDIAITTTRNGAGGWSLELRLNTRNSGAAANGSISARVATSGGKPLWTSSRRLSFAPGATSAIFRAEFPQAEPWSPASPVLHTLTVTTATPFGSHARSLRFGFRQIEVKGTQFLLNGQPVFFKGVNRHEMLRGAGMTLTPEETRRDLEDIKALGSNFVRTAHYTQDESFFDLADELGLLVWTEIPAWQTRAEVLGDEQVWRVYGEPQLREMVDGYKHHTSIVVWSVGNEFPSDKQPVADYVARGIKFVRSLDPTRLVTFASDRHLRDISFAHVDFIAVNEYYGWYYGKLGDLGPVLDKLHQQWPVKPIIVAEFGSEEIPGWRNPDTGDSGTWDYSEDYHIKLLASHLEQILAPSRREYVRGALVWVYNDFPNPSSFGRLHPVMASYTNSKGLVTEDRQRKRSWAEVRRFFIEIP
jgi:beta-glucuronidase